MNTAALERSIDRYLTKQADSVLGQAETTAGALGQGALYAVPVVGSGLSIADGVNDLYHGRIWSGLGNLGLGIGTGLLDLISFGGGGTAVRGLLGVGKAGRTAFSATRAGRAMAAATKGLRATRTGRLAWRYGLKPGLQVATGLPPAATIGGRMAERALVNNATIDNAERYVGRKMGWIPEESEWEKLTPKERGNHIREWLKEEMEHINAESEAASAGKSDAASRRVHSEALPEYEWDYNRGTFGPVTR